MTGRSVNQKIQIWYGLERFHLTVESNWFWFWFWFYYALWLASVFTLVLVLRQSSENRSNWKIKYLSAVNTHAPFGTTREKLNKTPWINSALKKGMRCRDAAKRKAIKTKNPQD